MFLLNILKGDDAFGTGINWSCNHAGNLGSSFCFAILYTIKNNEKLVEKQDKREENYQKLLSDMTEKYAVVEDIRNSVDEIQKKVEMLSTEQKV